jgi:hypothetical protein
MGKLVAGHKPDTLPREGVVFQAVSDETSIARAVQAATTGANENLVIRRTFGGN